MSQGWYYNGKILSSNSDGRCFPWGELVTLRAPRQWLNQSYKISVTCLSLIPNERHHRKGKKNVYEICLYLSGIIFELQKFDLRFYVTVLDSCIEWMNWNLWTLSIWHKCQLRLKSQLSFFSFHILDEHAESLRRRRPVVKTTYSTSINIVNHSGPVAVGTKRAIIKGAPLNHLTGIIMM